MISRCRPGGKVLIQGIFNPNNVDMVIRYRYSADAPKGAIDKLGWNIFSVETMTKILKGHKKVRELRVHQVEFPADVKVEPNPADPIRSWTIDYEGKNTFINGFNLVQNQYLFEADLH